MKIQRDRITVTIRNGIAAIYSADGEPLPLIEIRCFDTHDALHGTPLHVSDNGERFVRTVHRPD